MTRHALTAAALLASTALLAPAANANLLLTVQDDGTTLSSTTSLTGSVSASDSDLNFSLVSAVGTGFPIINQPDLGLVTVTVSTGPTFTGGPHVITIDLLQSALAAFAGGTVTGTFTANALIGGPGPTNEQVLINGVSKASQDFAAGVIDGSDTITAIAGAQPANWTDEELITATFTGPNQELEATIELVTAVPEPGSLMLLGTGLVGMGWFARRRRRDGNAVGFAA